MATLKSLNNAYRLAVKSNQEDRITAEIGDTKQPDKFYPQVKLHRWGDSEDTNEVNLSVRLVDSFAGEAVVSQEADRVKWIKPDVESHFYEHPDSPEHPEGGFEFDITFNEKPPENIIRFSVRTKSLDFFYQAALTQEEIDAGHFRPENVVGSYAAFHTAKKNDYSPAGGKNYRGGKAFHIYRPKISDATGKEIWGDLNIDTVGEELTITIDQVFLDNATYPVTVDPTFGYTTAGSSSVSLSSNQFYGAVFNAPSDTVTATSFSVSCQAGGASGHNLKSVLVLHSDLGIVSNGVGGSATVGTSQSWITSSFSTPPTVTPSTDYVLGSVWQKGIGTLSLFYDAGDVNQGHYDTSNSFATPTNPTDAVHDNNKYSIYCTYAGLKNISIADTFNFSDAELIEKIVEVAIAEAIAMADAVYFMKSHVWVLLSMVIASSVTSTVTISDNVSNTVSISDTVTGTVTIG